MRKYVTDRHGNKVPIETCLVAKHRDTNEYVMNNMDEVMLFPSANDGIEFFKFFNYSTDYIQQLLFVGYAEYAATHQLDLSHERMEHVEKELAASVQEVLKKEKVVADGFTINLQEKEVGEMLFYQNCSPVDINDHVYEQIQHAVEIVLLPNDEEKIGYFYARTIQL